MGLPYESEAELPSTPPPTYMDVVGGESVEMVETKVEGAKVTEEVNKLSLLSTVSSTTNSHVLNVVPHVESKQKRTLMSTNITPAYHIQVEKNPSDVINPDFSDLPGLLLQVVLAVHSVVDQQLTCT